LVCRIVQGHQAKAACYGETAIAATTTNGLSNYRVRIITGKNLSRLSNRSNLGNLLGYGLF
jgi:hypothetical protein